MTLNNPHPCIIPFSLSVGGTCKYYITPVIIYVIGPKKDWGGWSRLPQVIPLIAQRFLWVVTEKEPSETCACWPGRKQLPTQKGGLQLLTAVPSWQLERKQGSHTYNLKELNLANNLNKSILPLRASRKECSLVATLTPANPEERTQPCCTVLRRLTYTTECQ